LCVKEEAAQQITHMKEELGISQQELAAVQQALVVKSEEYQRSQGDSEKLSDINRQLEQDSTHWKAETTRLAQLAEERLRNGEQALKDLKETHFIEINRLTQQLTDTVARYDKELDEQNTYIEAQRHQWIAEKDQLQTLLHKLEKQLQKSEFLEQTSRDLNKALTEELTKANHGLEILGTENRQLIHDHVKIETMLSYYKDEVANLKQSLNEQKQLYSNKHHEMLKALEHVSQLSEQLQRVKSKMVKPKLVNV